MAEIKIKKTTPIWPWIVGILAVLAILYFVFQGNDDDVAGTNVDDDVEMVTEESNSSDGNNDMMLSETAITKIEAFRTFIDNDGSMSLEHEYSQNALTKLIDATEAAANSLNVDIQADLDTARSNISSITEDTYEVDHADKIKNAGNIIVQALKEIQVQKFPDLEENYNELQNSVTDINPATQTLEQKAAVKNFYDQAGELLTNMKNK